MVSDMKKFLRSAAAVALLGIGLITPALAQSASEMAVRMQQLEEQVRMLMGQVEELNYEVKQLRTQAGSNQQGAVQPMQPPAQPKQVAEAPAEGVAVETLPPVAGVQPLEAPDSLNNTEALIVQPDSGAAPGPTILGGIDNSAAKAKDGGFEGVVLVPPSQQEPGDDAFVTQGLNQGAGETAQDSIETVALAPESPEAIYEKANESLLRRQFAEAEAGFGSFMAKYPDHSLAGSAQYWLGETFYAQSDFKRAAQAFLRGYKTYPKSRRAADSLLKLGISLNRLGQTEQACAAYLAVSAEYPKAVEARKRAQAEAKRANCQA